MDVITYRWQTGGTPHVLELVRVAGTDDEPFQFGEGFSTRLITVARFYMATTPVTQALWNHVVGADWIRAVQRDDLRPLENVSWNDITRPDGFLDRINASGVRQTLAAAAQLPDGRFRLPSEAEWEYAARGGPAWRDGFKYSGGNDIDAVAWYDRRHGDHTQPVRQKAPNQLGLYDMSGNVWEWCQDVFAEDTSEIPGDGKPVQGDRPERVLRGGCFHNWAIHCTVSKRYQLARDYHDGCIGFRLALAAP